MTVTVEQIKQMSRDFEKQLEGGGDLANILAQVAGKQSSDALRRAVLFVRDEVAAGGCMSRAMAELPDVFDAGYVARMRRGEVNGNIEEELAQYAA